MPCFAAQSNGIGRYVAYAKEDGLLVGDPEGNLRAEDFATRAEFLAIIVRFFELTGGENVFSDVKEEDWYAQSISAAHFCGIYEGYDDGTARPYELIKTEDAISVIGRYYNATKHKGRYSGVSSYAEAYFGYAFEKGMFDVWEYLPDPKSEITRGEIVALLYMYREENGSEECFYSGYPKLSENQIPDKITVDVMLAVNCSVYCILAEHDKGYGDWIPTPVKEKNGIKTVTVDADADKTYDIYIKAVAEDGGKTEIKSIEEVSAFAFEKGKGTEENPYNISNERQLKQIGMFPEKSFILTSDIQISGNWKPIDRFSGTLNGSGYKITGAKISGNGENVGLFSEIMGGTVRNLTVSADISAKSNVGIIAGMNSGGVIENCSVSGTVSASGNCAGGICGINSGNIRDCLSCLYSVSANTFAGGIAGCNYSVIKNCLSAAESVTSDMYAGGVSGCNNGGSISGCVAANMTVYNTMTYNSGRISTGKREWTMTNNYSYDKMLSNSARMENSTELENGKEISWEDITDINFYLEIGWNGKRWTEPEDSGFYLIIPENTAMPPIERGRTAYYPKTVSKASELVAIREDPKGYYVLTRDISLNISWKMLDSENGFSGTLDGAGHTIYNLTIRNEQGMFSKINGGTVKNLTLADVNATLVNDGGVITSYNYGYIENCRITGKINVKNAANAGGIASVNEGSISGCTVEASIKAKGNNEFLGGICAVNSQVISGSDFSGEISADGENVRIGGICGCDNKGYISEDFADVKITASGKSAVIGGICGESEESQIYKCASLGETVSNGAISGGICGLAKESAVYNCLSQQNISDAGENAAIGGICGAISGANVQNTYAAGNIEASGEGSAAGGVCGLAQDSFIMQNVSLNPSVSSRNGTGAVAGISEESDISDNYSCSKTYLDGKHITDGEKNGSIKPFGDISAYAFYLSPLSEGGLLGWDKGAWTRMTGYTLPVLTKVKGMDRLKMPVYKY